MDDQKSKKIARLDIHFPAEVWFEPSLGGRGSSLKMIFSPDNRPRLTDNYDSMPANLLVPLVSQGTEIGFIEFSYVAVFKNQVVYEATGLRLGSEIGPSLALPSLVASAFLMEHS